MGNTGERSNNMLWKIKTIKVKHYRQPILIAGLPGIGNVGKVSMDLLIEKTKAAKIMEFTSHALPNSVFVNQHNLVELPKLELYHKKLGTQDFLFLTGDVQPVTEEASYRFCEHILRIFAQKRGKYIITLGGIGLNEIPDQPQVYITGNSTSLIKEFKKGIKVNQDIYGVVGPIMGVSGLLLGLAARKKVDAVCLLAETYGHPMYIGLKGVQAILAIFAKKFRFKLDLSDLAKEIQQAERRPEGKTKGKGKFRIPYPSEVNYIG